MEEAVIRATLLFLAAFLLMQTGILWAARQSEPQSAGRAFITDYGDGLHVYRLWRDGTGIRQMTQAPDGLPTGGSLAWSPDGHWLAYVDEGLILVSASGDRRFRLTTNIEFAPSWSPGSDSLAYQAYLQSNWDIYIIDLAGRQPRRLTTHAANDLMPAWSPNGEWIAFASEREGNLDIFRVRPDGSGLQNLTDSGLQNEYSPVWSPDGEWIHYEVNRDRFERMDVDGSIHRRVLDDNREVIIPSRIPIIDLRLRFSVLGLAGVLMLLAFGIIEGWFKFSRGT